MSSVAFNPGRMRHPIKLLHQTTVSDVSGTSTVWSVFASAYASIETVKAADVVGAGQSVALLYLNVTIRYQAGVTPAMRLRALNGTYKIQAIENVLERNALLVLTCEAFALNE